MAPSIRAGKTSEIHWRSGQWIFLDIGFSKEGKTCGLLIGDEEPVNVRFSEAVSGIGEFITTADISVNLVIEAPLSVAFTSSGNPTGRSVEKQEGENPRYWYMQGGCAVMVAAQYLVASLDSVAADVEVKLFEGFVSFKPKTEVTDHSKDVLLLRQVVQSPAIYEDAIIEPSSLRRNVTDKLQSAFTVMGRDYGIPPIIRR